jgi:hypothetical protein
LGFLSFDETLAGFAQFDIVNLTGPNASPPDFPVLTPVNLSGLNLVVTLSDSSTLAFTQADFTLGLDGLSYDGPTVAIGGVVLPVSAALTGNLGPTSLDIGSLVDVESSFLPVSLSNPSGGALADGDIALIQVALRSPTAVPEPGTLPLVSIAFGGLILFRLRSSVQRIARVSRQVRRRALEALAFALVAIGVPTIAMAVTTVKLSTATSPGTGVAGASSVKLVATGLPAVAAANIHVAIAPTCPAGGAVIGEIDTVGVSVTPVTASVSQIKFNIPATVAQGTYFVSISGVDTAGTAFQSSGCSAMNVTTTNTTLNSCLPTSSLAVALGPKVTAYVPNGWWGGSSTGVRVVPIEPIVGLGAPSLVPTPAVVNSCSANPATGETVCTANSNDIYRINGSSLTSTVVSGATSTPFFSGGSCRNCGVAINALTNTAYITIGVAGSPSSSGIQGLNLNTGALSAPFSLRHIVSENISVDAGRNLLLTPGEDNSYGLVQLSPSGGLLAEFANTTIGGSGEYDSAAEDCTTGVALAANEFASQVSIADLNQATFVPGSPGNWSSPSSVFTFAGGFSAGVSGISVAPGSSHLGLATGEFGGQSFAVFLLPPAPATGGTVPTIVDYVYVPNLPNTPDGRAFQAGFDPHTITAYTSPNDGKPYAVIADWVTGVPTYVAVIDLQALIAAPRVGVSHSISPGFNLLTSGAVRYVRTF